MSLRSAAEPSAEGAAAPPVRLLRKCACSAKGPAAKECEACAPRRIQRQVLPGMLGDPTSVAAGPAHRSEGRQISEALSRSGNPLDSGTRGFMEQRFETGFGDVRIHDDPVSHGAARSLGAEAFTSGQHVHFGAGRWRPDTQAGLHLIAHELAHTVQERHLPAPGGGDGGIELGAAHSPLERDADHAADQVMASGVAAPLPAASRPALRRKGSPGVEKIEDLLSYGLFDWKIRDAEALQALRRLQGLSRIEQGEFMSDKKYADRLRDNLPAEKVPEFDAIAADVKAMLPATATVDQIIDKLSYGIVDWRISDREAVEALELLQTLSGEPLAIALKRIDYARLLSNLPEDRREELIDLMAAGLGSAGTFATSQDQAPGIALRSMDFLSDHGVMRKNMKNWSRSGKPYPQPDWAVSKKGKDHGGAISHTMGRPLEIDLAFDVFPATAPRTSIALTGKGTSSILDFGFSGTLGGGGGQHLRLTAPTMLPADKPGVFLDQSIAWSVKWGAWDHMIGTTGPFDIFSTISTPAFPAEVTTKRMKLAVEMAASAGSLNPHDVVRTIMNKWTTYNLDVQYANEWELGDDLKGGAQCIDLVRFVHSAVAMVGLSGSAEAVLVWARPEAPDLAIETRYGKPGGMRTVPHHPDHSDWTAVLLDGNYRGNNFEAALKFTADGRTVYYPGGVQTDKDDEFVTPDRVLKVFQCLAWIRGANGQYEIMEVPGPYKPGSCNVGDRH